MQATATLLLVEDDILVRDSLESALSDEGFEVIVAGSGTKALAALEDDAARFRAVVADIRLGRGPDGWAVGRRARELVPDMPLIYMSGDQIQDWPSKGVPNSVALAKPFVPAQLITAIATLLNKADMKDLG